MKGAEDYGKWAAHDRRQRRLSDAKCGGAGRMADRSVRRGDMEEQVIPIRRVQHLRLQAREVSAFPDDGSEGWTKSVVDPTVLFEAFTSLRLKKGFALRAYHLRTGGNGYGFVYAMPEATPFPEPQECTSDVNRSLSPPVPPGSLDDVMQAIEGDGSLWSYFSASLFARELAEFGALWHGCDWGAHAILGGNPFLDPWYAPHTKMSCKIEEWDWRELVPIEWQPSVERNRGLVTVTFLTYSALGREVIVRCTDRYEPGTYCFLSEETVISERVLGTLSAA